MRYYNSDGTNCLQCCIAGIFDQKLEDVINIIEEDHEIYWVKFLSNWVGENLGCYVTEVKTSEGFMGDLPYYIGVYWLEPGVNHAVIMQEGKVIHNPDPHKKELGEHLYNLIFWRL